MRTHNTITQFYTLGANNNDAMKAVETVSKYKKKMKLS